MSNQYPYYYNQYPGYTDQRGNGEGITESVNHDEASYSTTSYQSDRQSYDNTRQQTSSKIQHTYGDYHSAQPSYNSTTTQWYGSGTDGRAQAAQTLTTMQNNETSTPNQVRLNSPAVVPHYAAPVSASSSYGQTSTNTANPHSRGPSVSNTSSYNTHLQHESQPYYSHMNSAHGAQQDRPQSVNSIRSASTTVKSPALQNSAQHYTSINGHQQANLDTNSNAQQYSHTQVSQTNPSSARSLTYNTGANSLNLPKTVQGRVPATATYNASQSTESINDKITSENDVYAQSNISTVNPVAVYDPWPDYKKKLDAAKAAKEAAEAKAAHAKKKQQEQEEEASRRREQLRAQERMAAEEAQRRALEESRVAKEVEGRKMREQAEQALLEDPANAEELERIRKKKEAAAKKAEYKKRKRQELKEAKAAAAAGENASTEVQTTALNAEEPQLSAAELKLREMMAQIRALNEQHPDLVAKVWEEERQSHIEKPSEPSNVTRVEEATTSLPKSKQGSKSKSRGVSTPALTKPVTPGDTASTDVHSAVVTGPSAINSPAAKANMSAPMSQPSIKQIWGFSAASGGGLTADALQKTTAAQAQSALSKGMKMTPAQQREFARITAEHMKTLAVNRDAIIAPSQIERVLVNNPPYIEFCLALEKLGLRFDRSTLAKKLLPALPPKSLQSAQVVNQANAQNNDGAAAARNMSSTTPILIASNRHSSAAESRQPSRQPSNPLVDGRESYPGQNGQVATSGLSQPGQIPDYSMLGFVQPSGSRPNVGSDHQQLVRSGPAPGDLQRAFDDGGRRSTSLVAQPPESKLELARKRTIASLVDLTAVSDDEELPPPKRFVNPTVPPAYPPQHTLHNSFARHQDQTSANQSFNSVNHMMPSNVSHSASAPTFDGITRLDPPLAQAPAQSLAISTIEKSRGVSLAEPISRDQARRRNFYDLRTIARDVLLATGRHPGMAPLNAHLLAIRRMYQANLPENTDMATLRWDLLDPGDPIIVPGLEEDKGSVNDGDADDESEPDYAPIVPRIAPRIAVADGIEIPDLEGPLPDNPPGKAAFSSPRPRGRPRKIRHSDAAGGLFDQRTKIKDPARRKTTGGLGALNGGSSHASSHKIAGSSYVAYREFMAAKGTPVPPSLGRPFGWRSNWPDLPGAREFLERQQARQPAPKVAGPPPAARLPAQPNPVFQCRWENCKAELHNLSTLKKHVHRVHGQKDIKGRYTCRWNDCSKVVRVLDKSTGKIDSVKRRNEFEDLAGWNEHVQRAHITPVAWSLGDGPASSVSGAEDSEAYLSDSRGRQVTPRVQVPATQGPSASTGGDVDAPIPVRIPKVARKTPEEHAREVFEQAAYKKKLIGPGLDRGGARLVNAKRRAGFVDDEDIERIVDDDEDEDGDILMQN